MFSLFKKSAPAHVPAEFYDLDEPSAPPVDLHDGSPIVPGWYADIDELAADYFRARPDTLLTPCEVHQVALDAREVSASTQDCRPEWIKHTFKAFIAIEELAATDRMANTLNDVIESHRRASTPPQQTSLSQVGNFARRHPFLTALIGTWLFNRMKAK